MQKHKHPHKVHILIMSLLLYLSTQSVSFSISQLGIKPTCSRVPVCKKKNLCALLCKILQLIGVSVKYTEQVNTGESYDP